MCNFNFTLALKMKQQKLFNIKHLLIATLV